MKQKLYLLIAGLLLLTVQLKAQAPNSLNYQGVARGITGDVLPDQTVTLRFTIHQGSASGTTVYQETQLVTTNEFGLFTVALGTGTIISGDFSTIAWGTGLYYLQVEMDPSGGSNYFNMGTNQFLSVPYALYAASSGNSSGVTKVVAGYGLTHDTITTTGTLSIDTSRGLGIGIPTIYFVDSSISASAAQPNQQLVYGTGTGLGSSSNLVYNGNQVSVIGNSYWGIINIQPATSGQESSIGFYNSIGSPDSSWVIGINDGRLSNAGFGIYSTLAGQNIIAIPDPVLGAVEFDNAYTFPTTDGSIGQVLTTNGSGVITWQTPSGGAGNAWSLTGNAGTTYQTNFIGTIDDNGLQFEMNNQNSGRIEDYDGGSAGEANTALGYQALSVSAPGQQNTAIGYQALQNNNSGGVGYNVAVGSDAMQFNSTGQWNTGLGTLALNSLTDGSFNIGVGPGSLSGNADGSYNIGIGQNALNNGNGSNNIAIGFHAAAENVIGGSYNDGVGYQVLFALTNGSNNDAMGYNALANLQNASDNVAIGYSTLLNDDYTGSGSGQYNTAVGSSVLYGNVDAAYNTGVGFQALFQNDQYDNGTASFNTALGVQALYYNIDNADNVAVGYRALYNNDEDDNNSANYNTAVGTLALSNDFDGSSNTAIGFNANFSSSDQGNAINNSTAIGANAIVNTSNTVQLGRFANVQFDQALMPAGNAGTVGQVLQSNGANTAPTWVTPSSGGSSNAWALTGNAGTTYGTNFIGTTDNQSLQFEINSNEAGFIELPSSSTSSTALGWGSLQTNTGQNNDGIGIQALAYNTGNWNEAIGREALIDNLGSQNIAIGAYSLNANEGNNNIAIGYQSEFSNNYNNIEGNNNTAEGAFSLYNIANGNNNTASGYAAGNGVLLGSSNAAFGAYSFYENDGEGNTAIGDSAMNANSGNFSTALGFNAGLGSNGLTNATAIGANAVVDSSNNVVLGSNTVTQTDFNGALGVWNGTNYNQGAVGQVLQSNGPDVAPTWASISSTGVPALTSTQIAFGDATNLMTSSSNLIFDVDNNIQLHNGNFALDNTHAFMFNGAADVNWMVLRNSTGAGKTVTGNTLAIQHGNGPNEGLIIQDNNGSPEFEILGSSHAITFNAIYTFPTTDGLAGQSLTTDGLGDVSWASPAAGWNLTGNGGTTAGTNFIGTTDANDLVFKTNSNEQVRITSNGNVGIGTNSPASDAGVALGGGHLETRNTRGMPTISINPINIGIGGSAIFNITVGGTDVGGAIAITTGFAATGAGQQLTVNFAVPYTTPPAVVITPTDAITAAAMVTQQPYITSTTTGFDINFGAQGATNTTYNFNYFVIEAQ